MQELELRVSILETYIPKFEALEDRVGTFIDRYEVREEWKEKLDKKRARIHFALLGGLITLVVGCAIALFTWVLEGHHSVTKNESNVTLPQNPTTASNSPY